MNQRCVCCKIWKIIKGNWKYLCILLVVVIFSVYNIYTIKKMDKKISQTIDKYEQAIRDIEISFKRQNKDLITEFYKLRLDWTNEKIELEIKKGYVDREIFRVYVIATAFAVFGSLGIGGALQSSIRKNVYQHISNLTGENKELIKKIIENNREEQKLKQEKKILILAQEKHSNENVEMFLENMGFENFTSKIIGEEANFEEYDLIFINNKDGNIEKEEKKLKEVVKNLVIEYGKEKTYFYYNKGIGLRLPYIGFEIKSNYSNSEFTLYRNLIDTLMISKNIKLHEKVIA